MPRSATTHIRAMPKRLRSRATTGHSDRTSVALPGQVSEQIGRSASSSTTPTTTWRRSGRWSLETPRWPRLSPPLPANISEVVSNSTTDRLLNRPRRRSNSASSIRSLVRRGARVAPLWAASSSPSQGGSHRTRSMGARHGAIEVMQRQLVRARDGVVLDPLVAGPVGTRGEEPVQDGGEDGALDVELEAAPGKQLLDHR